MQSLPIDYSEVDTLYRNTIGQGISVITITSPSSKEGTTITAISLAERSAAAGNKTLIIDLNILSPRIASEYSLGEIDWFPNIQALPPVQATNTANLWALSAPKQSANRWEFRDHTNVVGWINILRKTYATIIIDTSPLCIRNKGNIPSDSICACSDATLLCVLSGRTSYMRVQEAVEKLKHANANLFSAVLNDCFTPSLSSELIRESYRLERFIPRTMNIVRNFILNSTLLNQDV